MEERLAPSLLRRLRHAPDEGTFARELLEFLCDRFLAPLAVWRCAPPRRAAWLFTSMGRRLNPLSPEELASLDAGRPEGPGALGRKNGVILGGVEVASSMDAVVSGISGDEWFGVGNPAGGLSAGKIRDLEGVAVAAVMALDAFYGRMMADKIRLGGHLLRTPLWTLELALDGGTCPPSEDGRNRVTAALALLQGGIDVMALPDMAHLGSVFLACHDVSRRIQSLGEAWAFLEKREWAFSAGRFPPRGRLSQGAVLLLALMIQYAYGERGAQGVACILRPSGAEMECVLEAGSFTGPPGVLSREVRYLLDMFSLSWQESASAGGLLWKIRVPLVLGLRRKDVGKRLTPPRVLVVDDNATNRAIIADALKKAGCTVDTAEDGLDALRIVGLWSPDLVIMDILMPHMDGIAATRELRRRGFTVPVVALTAGGAGTALEALEAGMDDYALKPVPRKLLWDLVAQWTGYDGAVSPPQDEADRLSMEEAFAAELPLIRTALRRAWVAGNEEEARILAERLGSSAAQCGRDDLKRLAEEMEEALGEGRSAEPLMARLFEGEERF
ncbi:MAG TPA: response regulator [Synergistaceae bacterium]|nr:response regulator [Synergistaceae bacterium]HQH77550.1 response regulator [Synergistaceae bacterium]HQK24582.1 response regulator [Synergistaceae bacterium]